MKIAGIPPDAATEEYILATTKFVEACGVDPANWNHVQLWAKKTDDGVLGAEIHIAVNGSVVDT